MEISEVRIALRDSAGTGGPESRVGEKRLKAYVTVTFDQCFVVRNIKVIEGRNGLFVAMPSQKPKIVCAHCAYRNDSGGRFCAQCGAAATQPSAEPEPGEAHRDIAHPITLQFRQYVQQRVLQAYEAERARGRPGERGAPAVNAPPMPAPESSARADQ
jgi:stage V sporulation protein G